MAKELSHRGDELKLIGWSTQDIQRYIDLWDYRQRWGAINLDREDRLFLRKAESSLPEVKSTKASVKKLITDKSYYLRLVFFLDDMNAFEKTIPENTQFRGLWPVLLEEELWVLNYFQPVLGLPDMLKAKILTSLREEMIDKYIQQYGESIINSKYDYQKALINLKLKSESKWQSLREDKIQGEQTYPMLSNDCIPSFRSDVRNSLADVIRANFPSLADSDKALPSKD